MLPRKAFIGYHNDDDDNIGNVKDDDRHSSQKLL